MSTLPLKIPPPLTPARHRASADALTRLTPRHLGESKEVTAAFT